MSSLKPGTLCVIVGGCPENIGLIVEVLEHLGPYLQRVDAYEIKTVSGRSFHQLWSPDGELVRGKSNVCITDRHKLRPLVDSKDKSEVRNSTVKRTRNQKHELTGQPLKAGSPYE